MYIYLDVILLENFLVDLFLITVTLKVIRINTDNRRLIIASLLGVLYTVVLFINKLKFLNNIVVMILFAFLMMFIVVGTAKIKIVLKAAAAFIFSSIILSGVCFIICLNINKYSINKGLIIENFPVKYLLLSIMVVFVTYERIISYYRDRSVVSSLTYDLEITIKNVKYTIKAFLDTGNELREPITNLPCIIVEDNIFDKTKLEEKNMYYINYNAIGYAGKLKGFKVDKVRIREKGKEFKEINSIICPCNDLLSSENDYNALLSRGVLWRGGLNG